MPRGINNKIRCVTCGTINDLQGKPFRFACPNCGGVEHEQIASFPCCDFCGAEADRYWRFACPPFVIEELGYGSADDWAACDDCRPLVEAQAEESLIERWLLLNHGDFPELPEVVAAALIRRFHDAYFAHRTTTTPYPEPELKDDDSKWRT